MHNDEWFIASLFLLGGVFCVGLAIAILAGTQGLGWFLLVVGVGAVGLALRIGESLLLDERSK